MSYIKYIVMTILFSAILVAVILIPAPKKAEKKEVSKPVQSTEQTITLSEEDVHKGDLILVNNQTAFNSKTADREGRVKIYPNKSDFYQVKDTKVRLSGLALGQLNKMLEEFYNKKRLSTTLVLSGYRSKSYQKRLFEEDVRKNGEAHANSYLAKSGYSEHHTGLAVDFGLQYSDGTTGSFVGTENEKWIKKRAHRYGFILRFPDEKAVFTGISGEAWHYRYVGLPHSVYIKENNICLEEYITFLQNNATQEYPLCINYKNVDYEIFYTKMRTVKIPSHMCYHVSGDNMSGYIITTYPAFQAVNVSTPSAIGVAVSGGAVAPSESPTTSPAPSGQ